MRTCQARQKCYMAFSLLMCMLMPCYALAAFCGACGAESNNEAKYCAKCGKPVATPEQKTEQKAEQQAEQKAEQKAEQQAEQTSTLQSQPEVKDAKPEALICGSCGFKNGSNTKFCSQCGKLYETPEQKAERERVRQEREALHNKQVKCNACKGVGEYDVINWRACPRCVGQGRLGRRGSNQTVVCPDCSGWGPRAFGKENHRRIVEQCQGRTGFPVEAKEKCIQCGGSGNVAGDAPNQFRKWDD